MAGSAVYFVFGSAVNLVVFDRSGPGGTGNLASEVAGHFVVLMLFVPECLGYFAGFAFDSCQTNPPLYFFKWGILLPIHISLPFVLWQYWRLPILGVVAVSLWEDLKLVWEGLASPSLTQTNFLTSFLLWAMGYQPELGYF